MPVEMIIMLVGLGLGGHFGKALEDSGKENFTKDEILSIHASSIVKFCEDLKKKQQEEQQKAKEAELSKLGILPKSGIS